VEISAETAAEAVQAVHAQLLQLRGLGSEGSHDSLTELRTAVGLDEAAFSALLAGARILRADLAPHVGESAYRLGLNVGVLAALLAVKTEGAP
jgi:hypothetical protein